MSVPFPVGRSCAPPDRCWCGEVVRLLSGRTIRSPAARLTYLVSLAYLALYPSLDLMSALMSLTAWSRVDLTSEPETMSWAALSKTEEMTL